MPFKYHPVSFLDTCSSIEPVFFTALKSSIKIDGVKSFTYEELATATNNFNSATQAGQGGYGKVYRGTLADGMVVAIKRAQEGSLQGEREFLTEIQLLSRLHHRNLVSLIGYCDEEGEQVLCLIFFRSCILYISSMESLVPSNLRCLASNMTDEPLFHSFRAKNSNCLKLKT